MLKSQFFAGLTFGAVVLSAIFALMLAVSGVVLAMFYDQAGINLVKFLATNPKTVVLLLSAMAITMVATPWILLVFWEINRDPRIGFDAKRWIKKRDYSSDTLTTARMRGAC